MDPSRSLLRLGILAGPVYLAVGLAQALVWDGFDLARHPLSVLANGPGGWVQTANFVLCGLMVIAAAAGFARALRPQSRATAWLLGVFGASMIVAAIFPADPVDGFPVGTPEGFPTTMSNRGLIHFMAGGIGFLALAAACMAGALAMARRKRRSMAGLSLFSGVAIAGGFLAPAFLGANASPVAGIWFAVVVGWAWLAIMSLHLLHGAPERDPRARNRGGAVGPSA